MELGLFVGDSIEAECTNNASLEKLEPGDVKLKAPDEARLPFYHNYKLAIGWVLFVLILFVALLIVGLQGSYVEEDVTGERISLARKGNTYVMKLGKGGERGKTRKKGWEAKRFPYGGGDLIDY